MCAGYIWTLPPAGACENSTDSLVFETLIPKAMLQRYVSQLLEHRRIILSGPSGTGKSFLASRLAEHMVLREGRPLTDGAIATFNVDHKSSKVRVCNITLCGAPLGMHVMSRTGHCYANLLLVSCFWPVFVINNVEEFLWIDKIDSNIIHL